MERRRIDSDAAGTREVSAAVRELRIMHLVRREWARFPPIRFVAAAAALVAEWFVSCPKFVSEK